LFPGLSPFNSFYQSPFQNLISTGLTVGLGALAVKLFSGEGFAAGAKKLVGDITGNENAAESIGRFLGGNNGQRVDNGEQAAQQSGVPKWLKWLGIGAAGLTALNFVQDNLSYGNPLFGGFGFGYPQMGYPQMNMWNGLGLNYTPFGPFGYPIPF
jgi:hypothetical protein